VIASRDLAIWEIDRLNPAEDPYHCPPGIAWVLHLRSGWVERARIFRARRPSPERTQEA
jgi:hypothetical protein